MNNYELRFPDGSKEFVEADAAESSPAGDLAFFVRNIAAQGGYVTRIIARGEWAEVKKAEVLSPGSRIM